MAANHGRPPQQHKDAGSAIAQLGGKLGELTEALKQSRSANHELTRELEQNKQEQNRLRNALQRSQGNESTLASELENLKSAHEDQIRAAKAEVDSVRQELEMSESARSLMAFNTETRHRNDTNTHKEEIEVAREEIHRLKSELEACKQGKAQQVSDIKLQLDEQAITHTETVYQLKVNASSTHGISSAALASESEGPTESEDSTDDTERQSLDHGTQLQMLSQVHKISPSEIQDFAAAQEEQDALEMKATTINVGHIEQTQSSKQREYEHLADIVTKPLNSSSLEERRDGMNSFIEAVKEDNAYISLVDLLIKRQAETSAVLARGDAIGGLDPDALDTLFVSTLARIHTPILVGILQGNLTEQYFLDEETRVVLDYIGNVVAEQDFRPGIYVNTIGHAKSGRFLNASELTTVLDMMEAYISAEGNKIACQIDGLPTDRVQNRRYLTDQHGKFISSRVNVQRSFIQAARRRIRRTLDNHPDALGKPLEALYEFGYGGSTLKRLACHRRHESSNFLLNEFESACKVAFGRRYILHQHVIFLCDEPSQVAVAEIVFHLIGQGYATDGSGFSYHPAGMSSHTA
ncbi:hypothetical protein KCU92_g10133, partial [Aureobasidium melanogenum]